MLTLLRSLRVRGFVGPRYRGLAGGFRFLMQALVYRTEVVLQVARWDPIPQAVDAETMEIRWVTRFAELAPYHKELEGAYYPGFVDAWRAPFSWGERVALGLVSGRVVAFVWAQPGSAAGAICWFGPVLDRECRVSRMGVLPSARGRAYLTRFLALLLPELLAEGYDRVYSEVVLDNEPSLKAHLRTGFRAIGLVGVAGRLLGGRAIVWKAVPDSVAKKLARFACRDSLASLAAHPDPRRTTKG
jgi:GNAT superfamily N-acetyltransferase